MEVKDIVTAILLFGLFTTVLFSFAMSAFNGLNVAVDTEANSSLSRLYAAANQSQDQMFALSNTFQSVAPGGSNSTSASSDVSYLGKVLQTGYRIIVFVPNLIGITANVIYVVATELHIPLIFVTTLMAGFAITIILMIAGALLGARVIR
jgi:hypothetical protein